MSYKIFYICCYEDKWVNHVPTILDQLFNVLSSEMTATASAHSSFLCTVLCKGKLADHLSKEKWISF